MLVRYYSPHLGGNEQQCQLLAEYLVTNNFNVLVITERYSAKLIKSENLNRVNIVRLNSLNTYFDISKVHPSNFFAKLFRFGFYYLAEYSLMINIFFFLRCKKLRNEVLHIHQNNWIAFWGLLGINKRIPVIIKDATLNGFNELRFMPLSAYMKKIIIKNGRFVAISKDIQSNLLENGVNAENIYTIPNGIIIPSKSNSYNNFQDIIFVGNFAQGKIKGLDILINAIIHVFKQDKETKLLIIGNGDPEPYLIQLNNYSSFKNRIHFLGQIDNISDYFLNSFIFVLPSRSEGMSNALLEAMSYGMPCVSTMVSGSKDLIIDRENGLLVPIENEFSLAESILFLLKNKEFARELGMKARNTIERFYKSEVVYKKYEFLYKNLINA
jgi:glycosyltransferase involved in cell wall biosynthesis